MKLAWNILTTLMARFALLILALVSSVVLARMLGPEGRGLFALVLLLPELASSLGLLGFDQANAVYAGLEPKKRHTLVWQSAAVAGVVGGIVALAGMAFFWGGAPGFQSLVRGPLWLYILPLSMVPCKLLVVYWGAILRGMNHITLLNGIEVGTKVGSLALVLLLVGGWRLGVEGAVWADTLASISCVGLMIVLLRYTGVWSRPAIDRAFWRHTGRFAMTSYGGTAAAYLNYRADELIIAVLLPAEQMAFYVIAVGLAERLWILTGSVANVLLPHLTNMKERDSALPALIARHVIIWTAVACFMVFAFADQIVRILYSSAFAESVYPLRWLLPGILTFSVGKVLVAELLAREKPRYSLWATSIATVVNIACNLVLIPYMGIAGAALSSSISYSILSIMVTYCYLKETNLPWTVLVPRWNDMQHYMMYWSDISISFNLGNKRIRKIAS
jgi:O-antigen/teichoic acid export membrane protein